MGRRWQWLAVALSLLGSCVGGALGAPHTALSVPAQPTYVIQEKEKKRKKQDRQVNPLIFMIKKGAIVRYI
jgi:hypothetical protein